MSIGGDYNILYPEQNTLLTHPALKTTMPNTLSLLIRTIIAVIIIFPVTAHSFERASDPLVNFLKKEHKPLVSLLPEHITLTGKFRPSTQPFAGTVVNVQGTGYVYHKNEDTAYVIAKDHPIFSGDTLITDENSRVTLHLADDSTAILTAQSKLLIKKSLPRVKIRDTALHLFFGKVRSLVKKITGEYSIKTPTASLGVRGTDFIVAVGPASSLNDAQGWKKKRANLLTAVLTGGKQSTVELAGLYGPPIQVKPFSAAAVATGERAQQVVPVGFIAPFLLQKIAPYGEETLQEEKKSHGPCWTFSVNSGGVGKKEYFEVCTPTKKLGVK
jgi:hypothetical protein